MATLPNQSRRWLRYRAVLLISMIVMVPVGYWVRFRSSGAAWSNDLWGSVAYEIFWILLFLFLLPASSPRTVAIAVCLATCGLEFLQLWHPPFLQAVRATLPGRLVLGNTFTWSDFPAYWLGSALGWLWGYSLLKLSRSQSLKKQDGFKSG